MTRFNEPNPLRADDLPGQLRHGYGLLRQERLADAASLAFRLLEAYPREVSVLVFASEVQLANDAPERALDLIADAVAASGGEPELLVKAGWLQVQMRLRQQAIASVETARRSASDRPAVLAQLGNILASCNRHEAALDLYAQARGLAGHVPGLLYDTAVAQFFTGRFDEAERNLDRVLELSPQAGHALYLRSTLRRQSPERNHVSDLRHRISRGFPDAGAEASALYALAKELEDLGEHAASFDTLALAAGRKRSTLRYDVAGECASLERIRTSWTAEAMAAVATGDAGDGAIFIVGLPRTGTTLVERVLVQGGQVRSAGELLDFGTLLGDAGRRILAGSAGSSPAQAALRIDFRMLGREYMRGASEAAGGPRFIDKMPINYLYCGMIRKALPNARIIHVVRDPLDACHAIYKTLFFNAYHFSYSLDELAEYYIAYHALMRHWHAVLPNEILDVHYEDLVNDPDRESGRILEWCGLEWTPGLLAGTTAGTSFATASAAQVREPVHRRSIGVARRHLHSLAPLTQRLQGAGITVDPN